MAFEQDEDLKVFKKILEEDGMEDVVSGFAREVNENRQTRGTFTLFLFWYQPHRSASHATCLTLYRDEDTMKGLETTIKAYLDVPIGFELYLLRRAWANEAMNAKGYANRQSRKKFARTGRSRIPAVYTEGSKFSFTVSR